MELTIEATRALYAAADAIHDFDHVLRVLALAEQIARAEGADLSIVRTATLLHDWGRAEERQLGRDHAELGAEWACAFLKAEPPAFVEAVAEAIRAHRFRSDQRPATLEARVLYDADKLDAIGAVGIARVFAYAGAHGSRLWAPQAEVVKLGLEHSEQTDYTPVHEFVFKLTRIKAQLYTETARAIAEERHRYMETFFHRLELEACGGA